MIALNIIRKTKVSWKYENENIDNDDIAKTENNDSGRQLYKDNNHDMKTTLMMIMIMTTMTTKQW